MSIMNFFLFPKKIHIDAGLLDNERESVKDALKFVGEHPDQKIVVEVAGEKLRVECDGYGKEIKPA
ncbi:MAG: hypothetical protein UT87_C0034G0006 [Candidatus Levybacteria bacterium GW2011_GWC1_40_19]|nr:MAG: hypothetical protein UT44_C0045G0006 [Candidatus Levybacteria bacterium GW2011_GWA1_39_32]KKR49458.1 MAG: hypothetical protein UT87_C0034G0006 [Candidatus Levybacteria bacterium GW2011_GWC1_40_19]